MSGKEEALRHAAFADLFIWGNPQWRDDRDVVLASMQDARNLKYAHPRLRADREVALRGFVRQDGSVSTVMSVSPSLRRDAEFMLAAVREDSDNLLLAAPELRSDEAFLEAVRDCLPEGAMDAILPSSRAAAVGASIPMAAALAEVKRDPSSFCRLPAEQQDDPEFVEAALQGNCDLFPHLPPRLQGDKRTALAAVRHAAPRGVRLGDDCTHVIVFMSEALQKDREVVLAAVSTRAIGALAHASDDLRNDPEIVEAAMKHDSSAFEAAGDDVLADKKVAFCAITRHCLNYGFVAAELRADVAVTTQAVGQVCEKCSVMTSCGFGKPSCGKQLQHASAALRDDAAVVLAAVRGAGTALEFASERLRADRDVVTAAVQSDPEAISFASAELQQEFVASGVCREP